jgi:NO-binding membrane sensor protein with MHYT domain
VVGLVGGVMAEIHHFEYGWITPTLSYALSVLGSLLGLTCAVRVRQATTAGRRAWWLVLGAWAIGGTAIWTMHFMAMLGFNVVGSQIRYDVPLTAASALIAIIAVGIGLFVAAFGRSNLFKIVVGGVLAGLGVGAMHYTGMYAMQINGDVTYDRETVAASLVIAVVAATVALWLVVKVSGAWAIMVSALVMGIAVNGMHFTGMAAMSVRLHETPGVVGGARAATLLVPIVLAVICVVVALIYAILAAPTDEDRMGAAYLSARMADRTAVTPPAPEPPPFGGPRRSTSFVSRDNFRP